MAKNVEHYKVPAMAWLQIVDFTHAWLEHKYGGAVRAHGRRVLSVQHLPGVKQALRMETVEDMMEKQPLGPALSCTRMLCMESGLAIDADTMAEHYGVTQEALDRFVPIECPKLCLSRNGVLRPWTKDVCFSRKQAKVLQSLLREGFWSDVEKFDKEYAAQQEGRKYPAREMVEEFCAATGTPDIHVDAIRREWQRRRKVKAAEPQ